MVLGCIQALVGQALNPYSYTPVVNENHDKILISAGLKPSATLKEIDVKITELRELLMAFVEKHGDIKKMNCNQKISLCISGEYTKYLHIVKIMSQLAVLQLAAQLESPR